MYFTNHNNERINILYDIEIGKYMEDLFDYLDIIRSSFLDKGKIKTQFLF